MEKLTRQRQIEVRTLLFENRYLITRYRKNIKYLGVVKTKSGKFFHKWKNDDFIQNIYLTDQEDNMFIVFAGKIIPDKIYREAMDKRHYQ